uniref:Uncharacterized protein n=1 Tax=Sinocyclocheilus anshuiensis TaxID=1608454 RepID=A0A671MBI2_9TELE
NGRGSLVSHSTLDKFGIAEGYAPKMEDWGSVNRATFPSAHGVNGIDKSSIDADIKYPQVSMRVLSLQPVWRVQWSSRQLCEPRASLAGPGHQPLPPWRWRSDAPE